MVGDMRDGGGGQWGVGVHMTPTVSNRTPAGRDQGLGWRSVKHFFFFTKIHFPADGDKRFSVGGEMKTLTSGSTLCPTVEDF